MRQQLSDAWLVRRAVKGDKRAFAAIYRRYDQPLYRYCLSIVGSAEDAQDALQNTMVKVLRALPGERREIQLKPWLYRIAHNESIELLRRRREQAELGPEPASPASGPAEATATRERLQRLLDDISQLPERQRGALLMRELGGLGFAEIGMAFETSAAVARQTVYEARLSLGQLEAGREMSCEKVTQELSGGDGRVIRRREIQAHLRECAECRRFGETIAARRHDLAAIAPLPAAAASALLHAVLGGGNGTSGLSGGIAAGAGKAAAGSVAAKSVATVAVVAVIGASVADRSGLIDLGNSQGSGSQEGARSRVASPAASTARGQGAVPAGQSAGQGGDASADNRQAIVSPKTATSADARSTDPNSNEGAAGGSPDQTTPSQGDGGPSAKTLPAASSHGQETAASHGGGRGQAGSKAGGNSKGKSNSHSQAPSEPPGHSKSKPDPGSKGPSQHPEHPATPPDKGVGPDNQPATPLQPSEPSQEQGPPNGAGTRPSKEAR
jgi:RNA polymerase sigma factor (sigma-70 family)